MGATDRRPDTTALRLFNAKAGKNTCFRAKLIKRIPAGMGLNDESSNAAMPSAPPGEHNRVVTDTYTYVLASLATTFPIPASVPCACHGMAGRALLCSLG